jgi:hypothetical protein
MASGSPLFRPIGNPQVVPIVAVVGRVADDRPTLKDAAARLFSIATGAVAALAVLAVPIEALALPPVLVSVNQGGTASGNTNSFFPIVSGNGRFVGFFSFATDLVATATSGFGDVFSRDLKTGTTTLVSINQSGTSGGNARSEGVAISSNGRFVAFQSAATDLVATTTSGLGDVFRRDLSTGTTTLVSINQSGTSGGNAASTLPAISGNGRFVAFVSDATDLVGIPVVAGGQVFVRDMRTGTTTLVSVNQLGTAGGNSFSAFAPTSLSPLAISANGRFVAFGSFASDLVANDTNGAEDVFVRDLKTATTTLVSVNGLGTASGNGTSGVAPSFYVDFAPITLSANGRFVAFASFASDLVTNDTNGTGDIFVRDLKDHVTSLVSVDQSGTVSGNGNSFGAVISAEGRFVAFGSGATDLVANDSNGTMSDVFVRDLGKGTTSLVSVNQNHTGSGNNASFAGMISGNGRFVSFASNASDLTANDGNGVTDVFVRDLSKATTMIVSGNRSGTGSGNGPSPGFLFSPPAVSASGQVVVFASEASDLVTNDTNGATDVFVGSNQ